MSRLWVVATPIGNLGDLSPRAQAVLGQVSLIAAESVRRTRALLSHLGLTGRKVISCREANRRQAAHLVLKALDEGQEVALVSDAGTPGISDPGSLVVAEARAAGHQISPLPGPSSLAAALSVSGLEGGRAVFLGFLPAKSGARRKLVRQAARAELPLVVFEGPHRLADCAADLLAELGDRPAILCRELTKLHEEVAETNLGRLAGPEGAEVKGEVTLVVAGGEAPPEPGAPEPLDLETLVAREMAAGDQKPARLAKELAKRTGWTRDEIYQCILRLRGAAGE